MLRVKTGVPLESSRKGHGHVAGAQTASYHLDWKLKSLDCLRLFWMGALQLVAAGVLAVLLLDEPTILGHQQPLLCAPSTTLGASSEDASRSGHGHFPPPASVSRCGTAERGTASPRPRSRLPMLDVAAPKAMFCLAGGNIIISSKGKC